MGRRRSGGHNERGIKERMDGEKIKRKQYERRGTEVKDKERRLAERKNRRAKRLERYVIWHRRNGDEEQGSDIERKDE